MHRLFLSIRYVRWMREWRFGSKVIILATWMLDGVIAECWAKPHCANSVLGKKGHGKAGAYGLKHLPIARIGDAASFRGDWKTALVYPRVFKFFSVRPISPHPIHFIILNRVWSNPRHSKPRLAKGPLCASKNAASTALNVHTLQQNLERHCDQLVVQVQKWQPYHISVFWIAAPCIMVRQYWHFAGTRCPYVRNTGGGSVHNPFSVHYL